MATTTTNFNFPIPQSTDLVKDGATAIAALGTAIDTDFVDLKGGTTGQVLSKASGTDMDFTWIAQDDSNAIQNAIVDAKGDLIAASAADTPARLAVGNNGETLVADSSTTTGLRYQGNYAAGKNKIINGDFGIWQRGTSLSGAGYLADRFQGVVTTTTITQSQQAFTAGTAPVAGYESSYFYRAVTVTGGTAGSRALVQQPIEDVRTFAGQTVTISFWAKAASGTPKIGVELAQVFGSGGSSAVTGIGATAQTISTSWARYSVTTSVPSISGKTIGTGSSLNLVLWIDAGSDFAARASSIGNQSGTFDIWGVQVEASNVATAFQTATGTIQQELDACQRYYYRQTAVNTLTNFASGTSYSTGDAAILIRMPVTMRTTPTSVDYSTLALTDYAADFTISTISLLSSNSGLNNALVTIAASGLTNYRGYTLKSANSANGYLGLSAEL